MKTPAPAKPALWITADNDSVSERDVYYGQATIGPISQTSFQVVPAEKLREAESALVAVEAMLLAWQFTEAVKLIQAWRNGAKNGR